MESAASRGILAKCLAPPHRSLRAGTYTIPGGDCQSTVDRPLCLDTRSRKAENLFCAKPDRERPLMCYFRKIRLPEFSQRQQRYFRQASVDPAGGKKMRWAHGKNTWAATSCIAEVRLGLYRIRPVLMSRHNRAGVKPSRAPFFNTNFACSGCFSVPIVAAPFARVARSHRAGVPASIPRR